MGTSTGAPYNLRYPTENENPDVPRDMQLLATDVARELATLKSTAAQNPISSAFSVASATFTLNFFDITKMGKLVFTSFRVYSKVVLNSQSNGNLTDPLVGTITNAAARPTHQVLVAGSMNFTACAFQIDINGEVRLTGAGVESFAIPIGTSFMTNAFWVGP